MTIKMFRAKIFITVAIVATMLTLALGGCRSHRTAVSPAETPERQQWSRMQAPVALRLESPRRFSLSGTGTMVRDTSVTLSMRVLGMEVAVVHLTPDSLIVLDKYHKLALTEGLSALTSDLPVGICQLQDLMLGTPIRLDGSMLPRGVNAIIEEATSGIIDSVRVEAEGHAPVTLTYSTPAVTPYGTLASAMAVEATVAGHDARASVTWRLDRAKWDADVSAPRKIGVPPGYRRLTVADLVKALPQEL